jgi:hypothetical protein
MHSLCVLTSLLPDDLQIRTEQYCFVTLAAYGL